MWVDLWVMKKANSLTFRINKAGYIYAVCYASDGKVDMSIGRKCSKENWPDKVEKGTRRTMDRLALLVDELIDNRDKLLVAVTVEDIKAIILKETGKGVVAADTLLEKLKQYKDAIVKIDIKKENGVPYTLSTARHLEALIKSVAGTRLKNIPLSAFTNKDFEWYINYLGNATSDKTKERYTQNTICVYTVTLVKFFKRTHKLKWHANKWYNDKDTSVAKDSVEGHVYLSTDEIDRIYKLDIKHPGRAYARDLFVFGCYIGLRHIDLSRLQNSVYKGGILSILAKKGGRSVDIPLNHVAREIYTRYAGKFKPLANANFNEHITSLCKEAEINEQCLYIRREGGVKIERIVPKYQLCSTHTMRRSFATNALKAGVPPHAIMKITGHKTESSFVRYLRISNMENAEEMKLHAFFA